MSELVGNPLLDAWLALDKDQSYGMTVFHGTTWAQVEEAVRILDLESDEEVARSITSLRDSLRRSPMPSGLGDGSSICLHSIRRKAVHRYSWAIPSTEALDALVKLSPLVEIGAGNGYWGKLLSERGADIICYDLDVPGPSNHWHPDSHQWFPVHQAGVEAASWHPDRTLFICWPPYAPKQNITITQPEADEEGDWEVKSWTVSSHTITMWERPNTDPDVAFLALLAYEAAGGRRLAFIGEGSGGCTAGPAFFGHLGHCDHWGDDPCDCPPSAWKEDGWLHLPQWEGIHDDLYLYRRD